MPIGARRPKHERLEHGEEERDRDEQKADSDEEPDPLSIHAPGGSDDLAPGAPTGRIERRGRPPRRAGQTEQREQDDDREREQDGAWLVHQPPQDVRASRDRPAEEVGRPRPEHPARRNRVTAAAPPFRPRDRLGPLLLQVRAGRPVEECSLQLAPAALKPDPRKRCMRRTRVARDGLHDRSKIVGGAPRIVTSDPLRCRAPQVEPLTEEVRVRARGDVDYRVGPVDQLELVLPPARPFGALVLAVSNLDRLLVQCLRRSRRVEVELDHLPVAFVRVVPVVEDVEEPVLQCELSRPPLFGRHVRVDGGLRARGDRALPLLVRAAGVERVAGKVEVIAVEALAHLSGGGADRDQIGAVPGTAQRDRVGPEEDVDVDRTVGLAGAALLRLGDQADDGRVPLREVALGSEPGGCCSTPAERSKGDQNKDGPATVHEPGEDGPRAARTVLVVVVQLRTSSG